MSPTKFIRSGEFDIKFTWIDGDTFGDCNWQKGRIRISIKLLVVECFLHEFYHYKLNTAKERRVNKATRKHLARMSRKQVERLYRELERQVQ